MIEAEIKSYIEHESIIGIETLLDMAFIAL